MDVFLREQATLVRRTWILLEAALVSGALVASYHLRGLFGFERHPELYPLADYLPFLIVLVPLWSTLLYTHRLYHTQRLSTLANQWWLLFRTHVLGGLIVALLLFAFKLQWISRSFVFLFFGTSLLLLGLERSIVLLALHATRRRGSNWRNALIVGTEDRAGALARSIIEHGEWGLRLLGFVSVNDDTASAENGVAAFQSGDAGKHPLGERPSSATAPKIFGRPILGNLEDIPGLLEHHVVDEVIVCVASEMLPRVRDAVVEAELRGINTRLIADLLDLKLARTEVGYLNGFPVLTFTTLPQRAGELLFKRLLDLVLSAFLLVILGPLMLAIALAVRVCSGRPILFRQQRVGQNGRRFTLYKFRTMEAGADAKLDDLKERNEMKGPVFKLAKDPRVTPLGRFLRRWSLDELPQLFNVLRGEMSLVGPRPPLPTEVDEYETWQRRRLSMRPGITGPWQVSGRSEVDFEKWMRLDLTYIDNWSIREDLRLLLRTVPAVFSGRGAL